MTDINNLLSGITRSARQYISAIEAGSRERREQINQHSAALEAELQTAYLFNPAQHLIQGLDPAGITDNAARIAEIETLLASYEQAEDLIPDISHTRQHVMKLLAAVRRHTSAGHISKASLLTAHINERQPSMAELNLYKANLTALSNELSDLSDLTGCHDDASIILNDLNIISLPLTMDILL